MVSPLISTLLAGRLMQPQDGVSFLESFRFGLNQKQRSKYLFVALSQAKLLRSFSGNALSICFHAHPENRFTLFGVRSGALALPAHYLR